MNDLREPVPLLDEDARAFERDGFLGPIKLYEPEEARELLARIRLENQNRERILFDNDVNYDRHFDVPALASHIGHPVVIRTLQKLLGPDLLCWRTEFFPKFPGSAGTPWHQVANYAYATGRPMLESVLGDVPMLDLTVWTAFTPANRENGCMKFLPGSHKHLYYDELAPRRATGREESYRSVEADASFFGYEFDEFKVDPAWVPDEGQARVMEMQAGECVIFSARCVHGSLPNVSDRSTRFAISSRYVPTHVRVYPGWRRFRAHGSEFDLSDYGSVLVSGSDDYGHNRVRDADNWGTPFPYAGRSGR